MAPPGETTKKEGVNVQVLLRCRPPTEAELYNQVITCNEQLREVTLTQKASHTSRIFHYDKVFGPDCSQERLFQHAVVPLVIEVLDGFNCTIFAYGQTGTGKTYTMEGGPRKSVDGTNLSAEAGVIPRCIKYIFDTIEASNSDTSVKVSFLELYNEELTDLLAIDDSNAKKLRLMEDREGVVVKGIEEITVRTAADIYQVLDRGSLRRKTAETLLNKRSSRSHSLFTITIVVNTRTTEGEGLVKIGKLNLVDLAGSENISRSGAKDDRAREAGSINQSLLTLGRVINALVDHSIHIPYRDSKLTRLLRDSLGGRTKTCIIATIAPSVHCQEETISTLDYAHRAKNIRNRPEVNQKITQGVMIKELMSTIDNLKTELMATREKNGVYMPVDQHEEKEKELQHLKTRVQQLQAGNVASAAQADEKMQEMQRKYEAQVADLQGRLDSTATELNQTQQQLFDANRAINEREYIISAYQNSEEAVAQHAASLTQSLSDATGDLTCLQDKFGEMNNLHQQDRELMSGISDMVNSKLSKLHIAVGKMVQAQQQNHLVVERQVSDIQHGISVMQGTVRERLQTLQSAAASMHECTQQHFDTLNDHGISKATCMQNAAHAFVTQATSAVDTAQQAAAATTNALTAAVAQQREQLQRLIGMQREAQTELVQSAQNLLGQAGNALRQIAAAANAAHQDADKVLSAQLEGQQQVMGSLQGQLDLKKQELVQQMTTLMEVFMMESNNTISTAASNLSNQTRIVQKQLASSLLAIPESSNNACVALEDGSNSLAVTAEKLQEKASADGQNLVAGLDSCTKQLGEAKESFVAHASSQITSLNTYVQGVDNLHQQLKVSAQELVATSKQESAAFLQAMEQTVTQTQGSLEIASNTQEALHEALVANVGQALQNMSSASSEQQAAMERIAKKVRTKVESQLQSQANLDTVPPRRSLHVPDVSVIKDMQCPPRGVLQEKMGQGCRDIMLDSLNSSVENMFSPARAPPSSKVSMHPSRIPNVGALTPGRTGKALADLTNWQQEPVPMQD